MRMIRFMLGGCVFLLAGGALQAQGRDSSPRSARELEAVPRVKSEGTTQPAVPAPTAQSDSTAKPAVPRKSKAAAAAPRQPKKLPRVEKPAKPPA